MNLEDVIDKFLDSHVHIYLNDGAYVNTNYSLVFDKFKHDELFSYGYYIPDYKKWLLKNATLKII